MFFPFSAFIQVDNELKYLVDGVPIMMNDVSTHILILRIIWSMIVNLKIVLKNGKSIDIVYQDYVAVSINNIYSFYCTI